MRARTLLLVLLAALISVAALAPAAQARPRKDTRLHQFKSCPSLIAYGLKHASRVTRQRGAGPPPPARPMPMPGAAEDGAARPMPAAAPTAGTDYSTTNVQEGGVDEPDIVKTDGSTVFAVSGRTLRAVDVSGDAPKLAGTLQIGGYDGELLLEGDRLLVSYTKVEESAQSAQQQGASAPMSPDYYYQPKTELAEVDVSDPTKMRVVRTLTVDGRLVSSRLTGSEARVVLATMPRALTEPRPQGASASASSAGARTSRVNRRRAKAWLPSAVFANRVRGTRKRRALTHCRQTRRPKTFSGLGMLTVLTIDLRKGLEPVDSDSLMTSGETVYASPSSLYVATQKYMPELWSGDPEEIPSTVTTQIHKFDISDAGETRYRGSGHVAGWLLSQFSMSEHKGVLRVASTSQPPWVGGTDNPTQSYVTTLEEREGALARLGRVGGMGKGERIYAVRFIDDVGYVVTFRQVDPLYTVDVSDPAQPRVVGELKVLGYSAYLHPVGDGLLIGVGQDATEEGFRTGTQISLFDVSDPAAPTRLHHIALGQSHSEAEYDHHAFLWWPATRLAVLPVSIYGDTGGPRPAGEEPESSEESERFFGAIGFSVDRAAMAEAGRIEHPSPEDYAIPIRRSLVVRDHLLTVSDHGLKASRLDTLADVAWVPFGG